MADPVAYRAEAVTSATSVTAVEDALEIVRPPLLVLWCSLAALVFGLLAWSAVTDVPVKVAGRGILLASAGVTDIVADTEGRVVELLVHPGDLVAEGATVAVVDQSEQLLQRDAAAGELRDAEATRAELVRFQTLEAEADTAWRMARDEGLGQTLISLQERQRLMTEREAVMRDLADRALTTRDRVLQARMELFGLRDQIETIRNDRRVLVMDSTLRQTQRQRDLLAADQRIATAARQVASYDDRIRRLGAIRSPYAGRVVEAKANAGQVVGRSDPLLTLVRGDATGGLVALIYVDAQDGKKLQRNMVAELSPASTRREEHGTMRGHVLRIADTPASSAGMLRVLQNDALVRSFQDNRQTLFEVNIALEHDAAGRLVWENGAGPDFSIEGGTPVTMQATVRRVRMISLAIPALQRWLGEDVRGALPATAGIIPPATAVN